MRTILTASVMLAACGGGGHDDLPSEFRIDAEIVSVEPWRTQDAHYCTPTTTDIDPTGPDWQLRFDRVNDPEEPTFKAWSGHNDTDSAYHCQEPGAPGGGNADCCRPLADTGDGWVLDCDGVVFTEGRHRFVFTFRDGGAGSAVVTAYNDTLMASICTATVEWSGILPSSP